MRPLANNPLRASGPIRRTCGVIKLPVIWVAPPTDDDIKNDVMSAPLTLSAQPIGQPKPQEASKPPGQVTTLAAPVGNGAAELVVPALWENRLVGVKPCNHETGMEIVVAVNKPQNGLSVCGAGALPDGTGMGADTTTTTGMNDNNLSAHANAVHNLPAIQNLIKQQQQQQQQQQKKANLVTSLASQVHGISSINTTSPSAQSLIQSLKSQQQKHLVSSAALLSQPGIVLTSASLSNLIRQQQQLKQQPGSIGLTVTSGRTTTNAVNSTAVGSVSSIGMAAVGNGRLPSQDGGGSVVIKHGSNVHHATSGSNQHQSHLSNIKFSMTGGAASTNPFSSASVSASMVSNGPSIINMDTGNDLGGAGSKFVSDSEIRLQEEKVRQLRQQLLAAAQAAAKGSTVV